MEQFGEVITVENDTALIKVRKHAACHQCGRCSISITGGEPLDPVVEVENIIGARVGQIVKITVESKKLLFASFVVYLVPVLFLILGIALGPWLVDITGLAPGVKSGDMVGLAAGLVFMVVVFFFIRQWDKKLSSSDDFKPVAVAVIDVQDLGLVPK